jgi:hypothetical protein
VWLDRDTQRGVQRTFHRRSRRFPIAHGSVTVPNGEQAPLVKDGQIDGGACGDLRVPHAAAKGALVITAFGAILRRHAHPADHRA